MKRSSSPGLGQWLFVSIMIIGVMFLFYKVYAYGAVRRYLPTGLTIAGVDVGGYTLDEAGQILTDRYINAPITIYYRDEAIPMSPTQAEFVIDREAMLSEADYQRVQQDFWAGFWGYLWGRPVEVEMVELKATHNREALLSVLRVIAREMDQQAQPPQPVPATLSFHAGAPGMTANVEGSLRDIESALYRPFRREGHLIIEQQSSQRPEIRLLSNLITNHLAKFDGVASVFVMDLRTGEEIAINGDQPMSGMTIVQLPIVLETFRILDLPLNQEQQTLVVETMVVPSGNVSANLLLDVVAGESNAYLGADMVTESMGRLGLVNTFITTPYDEQPRPGRGNRQTPANSRSNRVTEPDPTIQTTAEDMGALLSMLYYCAQDGGGALLAAYINEMSQEKCRAIIDYMTQNHIGSLIEEGVPEDTAVAHKHGWISDTHGDAGIVFSPAGDYVIVIFMFKPGWLEWEISSPLIADISLATYNYFNFENPYSGR